MTGLTKELTFEERATWGECPVCKAEHGHWCHAEIGFQLGIKLNYGRMQTGEGAHLGRLQRAPHHVKLVPTNG